MALGTKYIEQDIRHFRSMIEVEEGLLTEALRLKAHEQIESSREIIEYYKTKIHNLIERGDEDG